MSSSPNNPNTHKGRVSPALLETVADDYGTPVFVAVEGVFRDNCRRFQTEFRCGTRRCVAAYSYKTNNLKAFCSIALEEGLGAEVVSPAELDMALELGVPGERIFYNGPLKTAVSMEKAIRHGTAIHVDSMAELQTLGTLAESLHHHAMIGLRLTPEFAEEGSLVWNKFGLSVREGEVEAALRFLADKPSLICKGLHMHVGTNQTDAEVYRRTADAIVGVLDLARKTGIDQVQYLDIGGGFSAESAAIPLMAHAEEWCPINLPDVMASVGAVLDSADPKGTLALVAEPGRAVAEAAMSLLVRVISVKRRGGRLQVIVDAGTNVLPTAYYTRHPFSFPSASDVTTKQVASIHGPLCTQFDLLAAEQLVPSIAPGDLVLIGSTGAYAHSFSAQFVGPRPPVVLLSPGETQLVREKEPDNILWLHDRVPKR